MGCAVCVVACAAWCCAARSYYVRLVVREIDSNAVCVARVAYAAFPAWCCVARSYLASCVIWCAKTQAPRLFCV